MNRDDIIRMARQAYVAIWHKDLKKWTLEPGIERFAALVAAAEREACAQMVEELNEIGHSYGLENRIRARGQA